MARNAAAMPQLVCRNCLRLKPRCLPFTSASSLIRASTFFCVALCGGGRYSPLETIWVGIGVAADAASAPATRRCSRSLSQVLIVSPPLLASTVLFSARTRLASAAHSRSAGRTMRRTFRLATDGAIALASRQRACLHRVILRGAQAHQENYLRWWRMIAEFNAQ